MKILFYIGYQTKAFNKTLIDKGMGLGGSEIASTYLAHELAKFGHSVFITGYVVAEHKSSVTWLTLDTLHAKYIKDFFDVIIVLRHLRCNMLRYCRLQPKLRLLTKLYIVE